MTRKNGKTAEAEGEIEPRRDGLPRIEKVAQPIWGVLEVRSCSLCIGPRSGQEHATGAGSPLQAIPHPVARRSLYRSGVSV